MQYYPPCIKRLAAQPKKGNYGRFLLSTFLLAIHSEKDARYQLSLMLTDDENNHMWTGNCKDQWKTIVSRNYAPPSMKTMIDTGLVEDDDEIPPTLTNLEFYGYEGKRT
jgi:DNA primase large subunit